VRDRLEEMPNFATELDLVNAEDGNTIEASMNKKLSEKVPNKAKRSGRQAVLSFCQTWYQCWQTLHQ
jgi:hypothetical protein